MNTEDSLSSGRKALALYRENLAKLGIENDTSSSILADVLGGVLSSHDQLLMRARLLTIVTVVAVTASLGTTVFAWRVMNSAAKIENAVTQIAEQRDAPINFQGKLEATQRSMEKVGDAMIEATKALSYAQGARNSAQQSPATVPTTTDNSAAKAK